MKIASAGKRLVNKLADQCTQTVKEVKLAENENSYKCNSYILYIVLFSIFLTINVGIVAYFACYKYMNRNKENVCKMIMFIKPQFN